MCVASRDAFFFASRDGCLESYFGSNERVFEGFTLFVGDYWRFFRTQQEQLKRKSLLEEIDEIKKKKRKMDTDIKSLNETADELCLKAESTGKLIFVTQANSLRKTAKEKFQELTDLNASLNSKLEKLKE